MWGTYAYQGGVEFYDPSEIRDGDVIKINNTLMADDRYEYYNNSVAVGSTYLITDIKANAGHQYMGGAQSYSGTVSSPGVQLRLAFNSYATLKVNGLVDGVPVDDLTGYGSINVAINDSMDAYGVSSYNKNWPCGSQYRVWLEDVPDGIYCAGLQIGQYTGTLDSAVTTLTFSFYTIRPVSGDWQEANELPPYIDPNTVEVEYKGIYEDIESPTSPGEGWVHDEGKTIYVNVGGIYDSNDELPTSETRVLEGLYFYHYCGASKSDVNFYYTDAYNTYHNIGDVNNWEQVDGWDDYEDKSRFCFVLNWKSGQWAGKAATCADNRSNVYYVGYRYQDKQAVITYTWSKPSDWQTERDDAADSVLVRYRLKDAAAPEISGVQVVSVSPSGFALSALVSDDSGIASVRFGVWREDQSEEDAQWLDAQLTDNEDAQTASAAVDISNFNNKRDCHYLSRVVAVDLAGKETVYPDTLSVLMPYVIRSDNRLVLPANLTVVEEYAFDGDNHLCEVVLPDGMQRIDRYAFAHCARMTVIIMPDTVTNINAEAFVGSGDVVFLCESNNKAAEFARQYDIPYLTEGY